MRLFVWEYLSSGACPEAERFPSLATEGWAMWSSLVEDCARIPGLKVVSMLSASRKNFHEGPAVQVHFVERADEEGALFPQLARQADAVCLIAPESDGILQQRVAMIEQIRQERGGIPDLWNATSSAISRCTDKYQLAQLWQQAGIPTPPTQLWDPPCTLDYPCVVKPRDGAGSQLTFLVRNRDEETAAEETIARERGEDFDRTTFLRQPYFPGRALSVALLVDSQIDCYVPLPPTEQRLSEEGRFRYLGGLVPAPAVNEAQLQELAIAACRVVPGLRGYVGVDLVMPNDPKYGPQVIEINPRLTTSYLGYRALCRENLALSIQNPTLSTVLTWKSEPIQFDSHGQIR